MRTLIKTALLLFLLSVPVITLYAQTSQKQDLQKWSIDGRVSNSLTKTPIADATVFLFREDTNSFEATARTDQDGRFLLEGNYTGNLRLFADSPEHLRTEYGASDSNQPGTILSVWPTRRLTGLEIDMFTGGSISGKILEHETRKPLEGCRIAALRPTLFRGLERNVSVGQTSSIEDGTFTIPNIATGEYKIQFRCSDERTGNQSVTYYPNATDATGASSVAVTSGKNSLLGVLETDLRNTSTVLLGTLHLGNRADKTIKIDLYSLTDLIPTPSAPLHCQITGNQRFSCKARPGVYRLTATWQSAGGSAESRSVQTITISSRPSSPVELTLTEPPDITVRLNVNSSDTDLPSEKSGATGTIPPLRVTFASRDGYWDAGPVNCTLPELCHIAVSPGSYRVQVQGLPPGYFVASVASGGIVESDPLAVTINPHGMIGEVVVSLQEDGGTVTGKLISRAGDPVANRQVAIIPKDDTLKYVFYQFANTGPSGQFGFQSVPSGLYELRTSSGLGPEAIFERDVLVLASISLKPKDISSGVYTVSK